MRPRSYRLPDPAPLVLRAAVLGMIALAGCGHVVRLTRPEHVGDRYHASMQGSERGTVALRGEGGVLSREESKLEVTLDGTAEVLAVDHRAQATRLAFQVERSSATGPGGSHEVLPAGTTLTVEAAGGGSAFLVGGGPVGPEIRKALEVVLSAHRPDRPTDDDIFGTRARRRVGDSWPIDARAAAADLARTLDSGAGDLRVTGATTLRAARPDAGEPCLEIEGRMSVAGLPVSMPPGFAVTQADSLVTFWGLLPADPASPLRHGERLGMTMTVRATGRSREGKPVEMELQQERALSRQLAPAPR